MSQLAKATRAWLPKGNSGWRRGWEGSCGAQHSSVLPMCQQEWPSAGMGEAMEPTPLSQEGGVGRLAHGTGAASQSVAHGQMAESWSCVPPKANPPSSPWDGGICATKAQI